MQHRFTKIRDPIAAHEDAFSARAVSASLLLNLDAPWQAVRKIAGNPAISLDLHDQSWHGSFMTSLDRDALFAHIHALNCCAGDAFAGAC